MLSRVAAVMAPRTHNRRRVTGSSGRRSEGRESEPQRPNMSRRVFTSAVLLLVVIIWCGTGGAAASDAQSSEPKFEWKDVKNEDGVTVDSLGVPGLLKVGSDVFAVAEAQCKKDGKCFTGIASQLLSMEKDKAKEEVLEDAKDTKVLEEGGSEESKKEVDVRRPTTVVDESNIYMLVGKHSHDAADTCQTVTGKIKSGILLVKGQVSGEDENKQIHWKDTDGLPCTLGEKHKSLTGLIGGGGSGVKMNDDTLAFPVEGTKKGDAGKDGKAVSLILYSSKEVTNWNLSKGMSDDGCSVPSVVEWEKDKLMMMTACDDGRRRVYEIGDKGESWTEALGTLSRVWDNKQQGNEKGFRSGFTTANIEDRDVMLVTLPVYAKKDENEKGVLHLWLTDNTHIVDIGSVSGKEDDAAASSLFYKSAEGESGDNNELIALYEKKKGDEDKPSPGMVFVRPTEQLQRVKDVLATWKEVDERVSKLCPSESAAKDVSSDTACTTDKITDGLVGFLSGNFSGNTWKDEYLGVNATVNNKGEVASTDNGVTFKGRGVWAEWPVGKQGENQLYHFANYNFTLVATVSIDEVPKDGSPIPLMGAKMNDGDNNPVLFGLSYNREKKWILLCGGGENTEHSSPWKPDTAYQVAIVLQNEKQGSAYVDGKRVGGDAQCKLENTDSKEISHFYIGGDEGNAGGQEGVSVTVTNVLLYNRPLSFEEVDALNPNKAPISPLVEVPTKPLTVSSASVISPIPSVAANAQIAGTSSTPAGTHLTEREQPLGSSGADSGGASTSAVSAVSTPSAEKDSVMQAASGKSSDGAQTVDGGSTADGEPTMEKREGTDEQGEVHPQVRDENATALNSSNLGNVSQENNSDAGTVSESRLLPLLLLLLGLWGFAPL
ncbi:trans-sialidase [Trypanosoma cruzi Dm28c]|uniref:Trans-sialidase n=2 Tax=Trypanosoma cruzi TaxID=5693 RepID=V5AQZ1_TRYCR|nr:trans-sialidase [Trypanosoma cruzi Dm28c]PBJ78383.1 trans-sialidase [Trypanosoma cruzi cruzi]PWV01107.1 putative trans-sialidase, Group VI [Trypanosoma cruzi]